MAVTALGSASFTLASMFAFKDGPMAWDASRVSAAIPSGASLSLSLSLAPWR
jgi:putative Mg2+ transporter-C (MgtC) family protein